MSKPPLFPQQSASGIAIDPRTLDRVIPESRRADGSYATFLSPFIGTLIDYYANPHTPCPILLACAKSAKFARDLRPRKTLRYFVVPANRQWMRAHCQKATFLDGPRLAPLHRRNKSHKAKVRKRMRSVKKSGKRSARRSCERTGTARMTGRPLPLLPTKPQQLSPLMVQRHHKDRILRKNLLNQRAQQGQA